MAFEEIKNEQPTVCRECGDKLDKLTLDNNRDICFNCYSDEQD
jgi:hypothetical protein